MNISRGERDHNAPESFVTTARTFAATAHLGCVLFGLFVMSNSLTAAPVEAPYGSWASPLSAQAVAAGGINKNVVK